MQENGQARLQAHCKWKDRSYIHCSWEPFEQLRMLQDKLPAVKRRVQQWYRAPKFTCEVQLLNFHAR